MAKRGRPPTGCPEWDPDTKQWNAWPLLPSGARRPIRMPGIAEHETERAAAVAKKIAIRVRDGGYVPEDAGESCGDYFGRWNEARELAGLASAADERGRWRKWIAPHLSHKSMVAVTKRELQVLVASLDADVRARKLSWKTAIHAWGIVTKMFDDAVRAKDVSLQVRQDNPTRDVRGPDHGDERASAFLFPSELQTLLTCERIPVNRRRVYALAVYLGARAGELRALEWSDVHDLGYVHVHRAQRRGTKKLGRTKTGITRQVPIEPSLATLLETMREESGGKGRVLAMASWNLAETLREDLTAAGLTRVELHADDETRRPLDFHDLRHTYGTWRAIRGDDVIKIRFAMGHTDLTTTQRYINEAQVFDPQRFGLVFGPLPELRRNYPKVARNSATSQWPLRDSENGPERTALPSVGPRTPEKKAEPSPPPAQIASTIPSTRGQGISEPDDREAELEALMLKAEGEGRRTLSLAYERQLEAHRAAKLIEAERPEGAQVFAFPTRKA